MNLCSYILCTVVPYLDLFLFHILVFSPLAAVYSRLLNWIGWCRTWSCAEQGAEKMSVEAEMMKSDLQFLTTIK